MYRDDNLGCACLLVFSLIVSVVFLVIFQHAPVTTVTGTVIDKVVDRGETYFVFRFDSEEDGLSFLKPGNGDVLEVGRHYRFKVRSRLRSWYRNILTFEEIP
jgi:hypothetical protein